MWSNGQEQTKGMGQPVIVQGTAVPNPSQYDQQMQSKYKGVESGYGNMNNTISSSGGIKGEVQPKQFNDVGFGIAFIIHILFVVGFMIFVPIIENDENGENDAADIDYSGLFMCIQVCAAFSIILSSFMLGFMMKFARQLVKTALFFSIGLSGAMAVMGLLSGQIMLLVLGSLQFFIGICYAYYVWHRIPFAAANLNTALTAVKTNLGLAFVGYFFTALAILWTVRWMVTVNTALAMFGEGTLFFLFLSYFWTHQVIQNTVHVTSAGVVGTWWFNPYEANSFCSSAIKDSFFRATTHSFGSICFGSLLVALVQALRAMNHQARGQDDCQILLCITDCILGCIEGILEYLNKWAYVYVGLYGYGYIDAGRNVMTLFQHKGWDVIITDNLVDNVLFMVSLVIGLVTGFLGMLISGLDKNLLAGLGYENVEAIGFIIGMVVGFVMGSILMSVVSSAVNTVIVCFAEAPNEFQNNHPELSNEMRETWRAAWPNECGGL